MPRKWRRRSSAAEMRIMINGKWSRRMWRSVRVWLRRREIDMTVCRGFQFLERGKRRHEDGCCRSEVGEQWLVNSLHLRSWSKGITSTASGCEDFVIAPEEASGDLLPRLKDIALIL